MNKPLQDCVLVIKDEKELRRYDKDSVSFLIGGANSHLIDGESGPKSKVALSNSIFNLMSEYEKHGPSTRLLSKLNRFLKPVRHQCLIERRNGKLVTVYVAHLTHHPDPGVFASYLFSSMASLGWFDDLKRCKSDDCKKFFIGRSNVKWCSRKCGSRSRVKKMRSRRR